MQCSVHYELNYVEILRIYQLWYIYTMEYYTAIKKKEILPFATAWIDLEIFILSEIRQSDKDKYYRISLICGVQ